jgi:cytochrome c
LFGVVGRRAGSVPDFSYSSAKKASGLRWDSKMLHTFLDNPAKTVKGDRMAYGGLHNPTQLNDLIAYLATLK